MKFPLVAALAAGVALVQVGASPIRLEFTDSPDEVPSRMRFGHALAPKDVRIAKYHVATVVRSGGPTTNHLGSGPCKGMRSRFRQKAVELSNAFRQALGLHVVELPPTRTPGDGFVHILPFEPNPGAVRGHHQFPGPPSSGGGPFFILPVAPDSGVVRGHPHHHHGHGGRGSHLVDSSFFRRLHVALMTLGPWEGRAFAFVLGCGIGVLLRMVWVLAVVTYRMFKGTNDNNNNYTQIFVVEEIEGAMEPETPAPAYTYPDEKAEVVVADDSKNQTA